jgi:UDP-N-acetylmuramate--alanine ligase
MVRTVSDLDDLCAALRDLAADGDMIICMGAGDITKWAASLAACISEARARKSPLPLAGGEEPRSGEGVGA